MRLEGNKTGEKALRVRVRGHSFSLPHLLDKIVDLNGQRNSESCNCTLWYIIAELLSVIIPQYALTCVFFYDIIEKTEVDCA